MEKLVNWWWSEPKWWEIWKAEHSGSPIVTAILVLAIIIVLVRLWG